MSTLLPSSINLIEYAGRPWSDIKFIEKDPGQTPIKKPSSPKDYHATRLLPREDYPFYGQFPKLESKILLECDKCGRVLLPCVFQAHCTNPEHQKIQHSLSTSSSMPTRSSNTHRTRKSATKPSTIQASASNSNTNQSSSVILMVSKPSAAIPVVAAAVGATVVPATPTPSTISKPKKNSKGNKRSRKEEKSEKIITTTIAATTIQSSEAHPKKIVKLDVEHIVATVPCIPSKPIAIPITVTNNHIEGARTKEDITESNATTSISHTKPAPALRTAFIKIASASQPTSSTSNVISINNKKVEVLQASQGAVTPVSVSNNKPQPQGNQESSSSVVHMPMSPVAVVNIVPVQYLQQYLQLPTQPFVVRIPCTNANTHMYSYPKPLTVSTRALRKIGNTYLLQNQRIDHQRAEIQAITKSRCAFSNSTTLNHLPT